MIVDYKSMMFDRGEVIILALADITVVGLLQLSKDRSRVATRDSEPSYTILVDKKLPELSRELIRADLEACAKRLAF